MDVGLIGINKYARFLNFACVLHAYAFQEYIKKHGYAPTFLDYKPAYHGGYDLRNPAPSAEQSYLEALKRGAPEATLAKLAELAMGYRSVAVERERRYDKFAAFENRYLNFTQEVYDSDLLEVQDPGLDCYVCVTDVIWQSIATHGFDRGFLLGSQAFEGKPKIAYAASRGASKDFSKSLLSRFLGYLKDFDNISVRERDFQKYITDNSDLNVTTVMDPVLLHDREFWDAVAVPPKEEKYLVLYYVMEKSTDTIAKAVEYAKIHDLTIVELSDRPLKYGKIVDPDVKHIARYDVGPEEWLGYIRAAECVFTNSFHGCCFSMLFERPLFVGRRNGQKVPNFLATFGLEGQQFDGGTDVRSLSFDIDYSEVVKILHRERKHSEEFILNALRQAQLKVDGGVVVDRSVYDKRRLKLTYPLRCNSGTSTQVAATLEVDPAVSAKRVGSGALEYASKRETRNDGKSAAPHPEFAAKGWEFTGWTLRFRVDNRWFWSMADGSVAVSGEATATGGPAKKLLRPGDMLPSLPVNHVSVAVLVAQWTRGAEGAASPKRPAVVANRSLLARIFRRVSGRKA